MWPGAKAGRRVTHRRHGSSRKEMRFPSCGNGARRILQVQKTWLSCKDLAQVLSGGLTVVAHHQDLYSLTHIIVLYFPFKIIIRTYFWGGEAYTLNSLIPSFPYFSYTKPLQAFAFPSSLSLPGRHRVWRLWDSGQTDPEPRMSKDYPKVPSDFGSAVIYLFSVPCLCSLAYVGREESLGLYLQMCGM